MTDNNQSSRHHPLASWAVNTITDERTRNVLLQVFGNERTVLDFIPFYFYELGGDNQISVWSNGEGAGNMEYGLSKHRNHFTSTEHLSKQDRAPVLEQFLKIEFVMNHLLMVLVGAYNKDSSPKLAFDTYTKMSIPSKLQLVKQHKILKPADVKLLERLAVYRNKIAHQYSINGVRYKPDEKSNEQYYKDGGMILDTLNELYSRRQSVVIDYLSDYVMRNS
jgi:hypothetical protein